MSSLVARTRELFDKHYVGASMKLVVIGAGNILDFIGFFLSFTLSYSVLEFLNFIFEILVESLVKLESRVSKYFGGVKQGSPYIPEPNFSKGLWKSDKLYLLKAIEDEHIFEVSWMIPPKSFELYMPELHVVQLLAHGELF